MSKEVQKERIYKRHGGDQSAVNLFSKMHDVFEPSGEHEERAINVQISNDMSREDVVQTILNKLKK